MKNKKVVVTGGAGFIGSNIARMLCHENEVMVIDDLSTGHAENIQAMIEDSLVTFVRGSITDFSLLQQQFKEVDFVFHQAALPSVPRSVKDPISSNQVNVTGTLNVLVAARDAGVKKVVYASSSSVYGDTPTLPKHEKMRLFPQSPYAVSKLAGEQYCHVFTEVYGLQTGALRYFNVYGPFQDPHGAYAAVIPKFIFSVLSGESPVIYGDGTQTRDFTFIADVVAANIKLAENPTTGVFNIAGGKRISIDKLAREIIESGTQPLKPVYADPRPGDILHSLADISNAKKGFGWEPQYDLKKGLQETFVWFQQQKIWV